MFSKKNDAAETGTPQDKTLGSYVYLIVILVLVGLAYYFREKVHSLYQVYVADSVRRMFGEMMLKMNLSPNGEFVSTYVPDLASLGKMAGISNAETGGADPSLQEIGLDSIGL